MQNHFKIWLVTYFLPVYNDISTDILITPTHFQQAICIGFRDCFLFPYVMPVLIIFMEMQFYVC